MTILPDVPGAKNVAWLSDEIHRSVVCHNVTLWYVLDYEVGAKNVAWLSDEIHRSVVCHNVTTRICNVYMYFCVYVYMYVCMCAYMYV